MLSIWVITSSATVRSQLSSISSSSVTTVGPYQLYGTPLVEACVARGTGYVDLCGEPGWMREMIDAHEAAARASGARIIFSCGLHSISIRPRRATAAEALPRSLGRAGAAYQRPRSRDARHLSGGTAASLKATLAAAAKRPSLLKLLADPFALTPGLIGPSQANTLLPYWDAAIGAWVAPFIMAPINTKNVHRTNFLSGHAYGKDFLLR